MSRNERCQTDLAACVATHPYNVDGYRQDFLLSNGVVSRC